MPTLLRVTLRPLLCASILAMFIAAAIAAEAPRLAPARFVLEWGRQGSAPGEFDVPIGIAISSTGEVLVSDFYNARVQRFNPDGKHVASFEVLPNPGGMALDYEGNVYLSHFSAMKADEEKKPDRISVYTPDGQLLRQWGRTGNGEGEFDYPGGIAVSRDGRVYVADQTNRRVQVFDRQGTFLFKWGEYGVGEGQFGGNVSPKSRVGGPQFLAIDRKGCVYTTEGSVGRIQKFTSDGRFVLAFGDNQDKSGSFGGYWQGTSGLQGPIGICLDKCGSLWISAVCGRVQRFTIDGEFLQGLGNGRGSGPGEFEAPHSLAVDRRGNIYVVDALNHRIQKFAIGE